MGLVNFFLELPDKKTPKASWVDRDEMHTRASTKTSWCGESYTKEPKSFHF